jgi:hypothetical protein
MKKIIISLAVLMIQTAVFAQSAKYESAMRSSVLKMDTAKTSATYQALANTFGRIADAEKNQWMPYYYSAYCLVSANFIAQPDKSKIDPICDQADLLAKKADSLSPNNSEIYCLQSMIASDRIMVDPMSRGMQYGMASSQFLNSAQKADSTNPRVFVLEGASLFYTPEQYGGSKDKAKVLFLKAETLFGSFKPNPDYAPHWGEDLNKELLAQCK